MGLKITNTGYPFIFYALLESTTGGILKQEKKPFYLSYGKAEDTVSPALPRVCGKELQLHPRRLRSATSSTFATVGFVCCFPSSSTENNNEEIKLCVLCVSAVNYGEALMKHGITRGGGVKNRKMQRKNL